jgi:hypothetical protein
MDSRTSWGNKPGKIRKRRSPKAMQKTKPMTTREIRLSRGQEYALSSIVAETKAGLSAGETEEAALFQDICKKKRPKRA